MIDRKKFRNFDFTLFVVTLLIISFGLIILSSATHATMIRGGDSLTYVKKQSISIVLGLLVMFMLIRIDYTEFKKLNKAIYGLALALLVGVLVLGEVQNGAKSWIPLGPFNLQPAEFAKIAIIMVFANHLAEKEGKLNRFRDLIPSFLLFGIPMAAIMAQPDLGSTLVFISIFFGMLFVAGARVRNLLIIIALGASLVAGVLVAQVGYGYDKPLKKYQLDRLTIFVDPYKDPRHAGYHVIQSQVALGSGGLLGKGLYKGTQNQLNFLPEQRNDFIFSVVGEELGFVGGASLLLLFFIFVYRGVRISWYAKDMHGSLLAAGVISMIVFHLLVNIGMTAGIMPITGIPLPFFSYGGSAMLANLMGVGLLLNVHMRRQVLTF